MSFFVKGKKRKGNVPVENVTVLFSIKTTSEYAPTEKFGVKMKERDGANVIEQVEETGEYIIVKEDKKMTMGYIPQKVCQRQIRKYKQAIPIPKDEYIRFLESKKYFDKQTKACIKIQRFYRWMKTQKVVNKKLDKFGERIYLNNELLENDNNYLRYLESVNLLFYEPLKEVLTVEEHDGVFANFFDVLSVAREVNTKLEEKRVVGLTDVLDKLIVNSTYISNYSEAMDVFKKLKLGFERTPNAPKSKIFLDTMKKGEKDDRCCGLNFQNLLIKPFQRLVTYQNIISSILKVTPKESYQHEIIEELLIKIKKLCGVVNQQRKSMLEEKEIDKMGIMIKGRKVIFKDVVLPVEYKKERFNGNCYLFNDLFYIRKKNDSETFSFHFFLTNFSEDTQQKKWMNLHSIYKSARVMFKKRKEKNQWLQSIQSNMTKTKILAKRRHGIQNISELLKNFKYVRFQKNEKYDERIEELKNKKDKQFQEIAFKRKKIHFMRLLVRNKVGEILKNFDEIIKHGLVIDGLTDEMNDTRVEKKSNIIKCMDSLGKFRECLNNDIVEFYKIFEADFSFCSRELEVLKVPYSSKSFDTEKDRQVVLKRFVDSQKNPLDLLVEKERELVEVSKQMKKMKRKMELIELIEDKIDDDDDDEGEGEKDEEEEEEGETSREGTIKVDIKKEHIDHFLKKRMVKLKEKAMNLNGTIMKLELNLETVKEEMKEQEEDYKERIEDLNKAVEEERIKTAGYRETVDRKRGKSKKLKSDNKKLIAQCEARDRNIERLKEEIERLKNK